MITKHLCTFIMSIDDLLLRSLTAFHYCIIGGNICDLYLVSLI